MGKASRRKKLNAVQAPQPSQAPAGGWPLTNRAAAQQLEAWFAQRGIDPSRPGIHDTPAFLLAERQDPKALNLVARLVEARSYSEAELQDAEHAITVTAEAVARRVERDGRKGLCVVASGVLSRMLDELGIWNYTAKTNLAVRFPPSVSEEPRYFYSVDDRQFAAPHAMVVAPPFTVIDVTVRHQHYDEAGMASWLPELAMTKDFHPYRVTVNELVSPEVRAGILAHGMSVQQYLRQAKANMLQVMQHLPARAVHLDGGQLGYAPLAVGGYQERLQDLHGENCSIDGMTPMQIFEQDVVPRLKGGA